MATLSPQSTQSELERETGVNPKVHKLIMNRLTINSPEAWHTSPLGIRRLTIGHLIHVFLKGKCVKCEKQSNKLELDPFIGLLCPMCLMRRREGMEVKPFVGFMFRQVNGKEIFVRELHGSSWPMVAAGMDRYVRLSFKKNGYHWNARPGHFCGGFYDIPDTGVSIYLKAGRGRK